MKAPNNENETEEKIVAIFKALNYSTDSMLKMHKSTIKILGKIAEIIDILFIILGMMIFFISILVYKVLLFNPINNTISYFIKSWSSLSESWKIFIVGIPIALIIHIIGSLIIKKIEKKLDLKNQNYEQNQN